MHVYCMFAKNNYMFVLVSVPDFYFYESALLWSQEPVITSNTDHFRQNDPPKLSNLLVILK